MNTLCDLYHSYMLYSISRPDKYGYPMIELSSDTGVSGENEQLSTQEKKVCQVLKKAFLNSKSHSKFSGLEIVPSLCLRSVVRSILNRMGSALSRMNRKQRKQLFERWEE